MRSVTPTLGLAPEEGAAHWLIRHDQGELSPADQEEFDSWLSSSPTNSKAYARAEGVWTAFEKVDQDPHLAAIRHAAIAAPPDRNRVRWSSATAAIAASIAAGLILIQPFEDFSPATSISARTVAQEFAANTHWTRKGERRIVSLRDGTIITLNTDSAINVDYNADLRLIRLTRGQALFDVAKDKSRNFVVEAAGRQITALGTKFDVRLDPGRMSLVLIEGRVVVDKVHAAGPSKSMAAIILKPGETLIAELGSKQQVQQAPVAERLLWTKGYVQFENEPLVSAVSEINRYSSKPLMISDKEIGQLRVSGVFRTGDPQHFAEIVSELLPVMPQRARGRLELVRRH